MVALQRRAVRKEIVERHKHPESTKAEVKIDLISVTSMYVPSAPIFSCAVFSPVGSKRRRSLRALHFPPRSGLHVLLVQCWRYVLKLDCLDSPVPCDLRSFSGNGSNLCSCASSRAPCLSMA